MKDKASKRILVVDNESLLRDLLHEVLVKSGYQVDVASDGFEALNSASTRDYDLIITDIKMPKLDGNELYLSVVQKQPWMRDKFLFTSENFNDLIFKKAAKGNMRHLAKPFRGTELLAYVQLIMQEFGEAERDAIDNRPHLSSVAENMKAV